jgi:hypothetical protein
VREKLLVVDGSPALLTFNAGTARYGSDEAGKALRQQLPLSPDEQILRVKTETDAQGFTPEKYQFYYHRIEVEHAVDTVHTQREGSRWPQPASKVWLNVQRLSNSLYTLRAGTGESAISEHIQIAH